MSYRKRRWGKSSLLKNVIWVFTFVLLVVVLGIFFWMDQKDNATRAAEAKKFIMKQ